MNNKWRIAIPIDGMKSNILPVELGPITILRLKEELAPNIEPENLNSILISIKSGIELDNEAAFNSIEFLEDALSIIRLFVAARMEHSLPALNIISLRKLWTYSEAYSLNIDNPIESKITRLKPGGRMYDYRLSEDHIAYYRVSYIESLLNILFKLHRNELVTELDKLIVKSTVWAGMMLEDVFHRDRFLRGVTALETLVEKSPINGIGFKFRTFGSKLYCKSNTDRTQLEVEQLLNKIYKSRCDISHGGALTDNQFTGSFDSIDHLITVICFNAIFVWRESSSLEDFYSKINT